MLVVTVVSHKCNLTVGRAYSIGRVGLLPRGLVVYVGYKVPSVRLVIRWTGKPVLRVLILRIVRTRCSVQTMRTGFHGAVVQNFAFRSLLVTFGDTPLFVEVIVCPRLSVTVHVDAGTVSQLCCYRPGGCWYSVVYSTIR